MVKDANYYIKRIKDLSSTLERTIQELYKDASSHRYIPMTLGELCSKLAMEYSNDNFNENNQQHYVEINSYLSLLNLVLIPCSVPVDVSLDTKIYVAPKPNLNNDEDCAAVQALIKAKKAPTAADAIHIQRMNAKLSNYNVMLRVFEGLFVICSSKLDPHHRSTLNNLISELEFPKEGLAYLRACYTYATELNNPHCDYKNDKYCFKPLNEALQKRVTNYLAQIAISSNYLEPLHQDYPYLDALNEEISRVDTEKNKQSRLLKIKQENAKSRSEYTRFKTNAVPDHSRDDFYISANFENIESNVYKYIDDKTTANKLENKSCLRDVLANSPLFENPLAIKYFLSLDGILKKDITAILRKRSDFDIYSYYEVSPRRAVPEIFIAKNEYSSILYPNTFFLDQTNQVKKNMLNEQFTFFLEDSSPKVNTEQIKRYMFCDIEKDKQNILSMNFFMKLFLFNTFDKFSEVSAKKSVYQLSLEYDDKQFQTLPILRAYYYILFELIPHAKEVIAERDNNLDKKIVLDDVTTVALYNCEYLTNLAINTLLFSGLKNSLQDYFEICPDLFAVFILRSPLLLSALGPDFNFRTKSYDARFIKVILRMLLNKIGNQKITDFIMTVDSEDEDTNQAFLNEFQEIKKLNRVDITKSKEVSLLENLEKQFKFNHQYLDPDYKVADSNFYETALTDKKVNLKDTADEVARNITFVSPTITRDKKVLDHPLIHDVFLPLLDLSVQNYLTGFCLQLKAEPCREIISKLKEQKSVIYYIQSSGISDSKLLVSLLCNELSKVDEQIIKRQLKNFTFNKKSQLCDIFKIKYSYLANQCIEEALPKLGLMLVPIDSAIPKEAYKKITVHKIISTHLEQKNLTHDLIYKLAAAQMALIMFCFIVPVNAAEVKLCRYMGLESEQNVFAIKFLTTLKELVRGMKPFPNTFYSKLYAEQKSNDNFKLCIKYLKQLAIEEVESSPLRNYLESKFNELFANFSSRNVASVNEASTANTSRRASNKADTDEVVSENTSQSSIKDSNPFTRSSLVKTSDHSFFKKQSFDTRSLNKDLIASKLKESSQIQNVIEQIRIDEGNIEADDLQENISQNQEDISEKASSTNTSSAESESSNDNGIKLPNEACRKLVEAIKAQNSDVIDLNEFNGICLSLKFMSKDAAIEELNDWSYENFDDPLFDVAPEENCVYITEDILDKL